VDIPKAYLLDGNWHVFEHEYDLSNTYQKVTIDYTAYGGSQSTAGYAPSVSTTWLFYSAMEDTGTFTFEDWYFDDLTIGPEIVSTARVEKRDVDDDYFYLKSASAGTAISVEVGNDMAFNRLAILDQCQELENLFWDIRDGFYLADAVGAQLDILGRIVGLDRDSAWSDEDYRPLIATKIIRNLSSGEPERLIQVLRILTASDYVRLTEYNPAHIELEFDGPTVPANLLELMDSIAAGGVSLHLTQISSHPFGFDGDPEAHGFDDGEFASSS
jgi:hypothetical protein